MEEQLAKNGVLNGAFISDVPDKTEQEHMAQTNPTEPVIIEGRPFTPEDFQHLDELNEEIQKQNTPKPYQWGPQLTPQSTRELKYTRFFGRPIILDTPTEKIEN